jgi:prepilin-type N-terminal cleavage/methylation domain-containing protein
MINKKNGFTLIELLVVIAILSVALTLVLTIFTRTLRGGNKSQIISSIKQNGQSVLETMGQTIRTSDRIICPISTGDTAVVVKNGTYTKFKFVVPSSTDNGYIQQEEFNIPSAPPAGSDPALYIRNFELTLCVDPFQNPKTITDTNAQSGASVFNGLFTRTKMAGFKDQLTIKFDVKSGVGAAQAAAGQVDPVSFQTTVEVR